MQSSSIFRRTRQFARFCLRLVPVGLTLGECLGVELRILGCPRPAIEVLQSRPNVTALVGYVDGGVATERIDIVGSSREHVFLLPSSAGLMRSVQGTLDSRFIQFIGDDLEAKLNAPMPEELSSELQEVIDDATDQPLRPAGSFIERVVRSEDYVFTVGAARTTNGHVTTDVMSAGYWAVLNGSCVTRGIFFIQPPISPEAAVEELASILNEMSR